ncbi:GNAT family N-acetyltransferase [Streptomyces sp. ISL-96]|uniref:GNAT family N-acetyltransferase n=1 Tax=Streptomyces sp. ISL-96 TaxID=2819191 RepID=UPI001BEB674C|nr:GNAT family N-acetyltransferase [Streptomyces sp. ISL-96]MBT2487359.1 GNAT family N-acetyltransferase [Streptomyces sp. ISL-96]
MRGIFLETERLVLRAFGECEAEAEDSDVERLVRLDSDPDVMRFINGGRPTSRAFVIQRVLPQLTHDYPCIGTRGFWAAEEKATGAFLGWFEFRPLADDSADVVELGYRLGRAAWGRGYATEGARALIDKGFTDLGVQKVTADTMYVNSRSRRVMEKAGLLFVRRWFGEWPDSIDGWEQGDVAYALERSQWKGGSTHTRHTCHTGRTTHTTHRVQ